jgi:hypothetical protein
LSFGVEPESEWALYDALVELLSLLVDVGALLVDVVDNVVYAFGHAILLSFELFRNHIEVYWHKTGIVVPTP